MFADGRGSRSGSQHRPHDNSQRSKPIPISQQNVAKSNPPAPKPAPRPVSVEQISPQEQMGQLERKLKNILEEYLNDCYTVDECDEDIRTSLPPSALPKLVSERFVLVLLKKKICTYNFFLLLQLSLCIGKIDNCKIGSW